MAKSPTSIEGDRLLGMDNNNKTVDVGEIIDSANYFWVPFGITVAGYNIQAGQSEIDHYEVVGSNGSQGLPCL